jgi:hypothetical protein
MSRCILLACAALLFPACYTTTIHSGLPASPATVAYDHRWHHGLIAGIAELSSPYDLSQVCPQGWSEIETEQSFLTGLLSMIGQGYTAQTVTIRCAAVPPPEASAPSAPSAPPATPPSPPATLAPPPPETPAPGAVVQ